MAHFLPNSIETIILSSIARHLAGRGSYCVLLFGSYAKGSQKNTSDVDIAIKSDGPLDLAIWAKIEGELEESAIPQKVDVIDYCRVSKEFQHLIDREGKILFSS